MTLHDHPLRNPEPSRDISAIPGALDRLLDLARPLVDEPDRPVDFLGKYELVREVGRGSMGVVYEATYAYGPTRWRVALKLLADGRFANSSLRRRFWDEAAAATRLVHPNIVRILEIHSAYLAMRFVDGPSLAIGSPGRTLEPARAARLVADAARAVHAAHLQGIVHRDLKPGNLLVESGDDGAETIFVTDFGLASRMSSASLAPTEIVGTPAFMAPEQAAGDAAAIGPASDVYALGATLHDLVAGRPPHDGLEGLSSVEVLERVRREPPTPVERLPGASDPGVTSATTSVIMDCLAPDPADRPGTLALAGRLDAIAASGATPDAPRPPDTTP